MNTTDLLVIIDPQNDFCEGGALAVPGADTRFMNIIAEFSKGFQNIVITQDYHPAGHSSFASSHEGKEPFTLTEVAYGPQMLWPDHCIQGLPGAEFHPSIAAGPLARCQMVIRKGMNPEIDSYSAFYENDRTTPTGLAGYVAELGFERVYFVGLALDYCVAYSALDAAEIRLPSIHRASGTEIRFVTAIVVEDMCRGISADTIFSAYQEFDDKEVVITTSDMV